MYCRDRNKNCIGRRVSGFELCVWICIYLTWWRCTAIRGHNFKSNWASCLSLEHITWKIISLLSFMLAARCIKGRDAITQMDTKNRIYVCLEAHLLAKYCLCDALRCCCCWAAGAAAHTLSAINSDLWPLSKQKEIKAMPFQGKLFDDVENTSTLCNPLLIRFQCTQQLFRIILGKQGL